MRAGRPARLPGGSSRPRLGHVIVAQRLAAGLTRGELARRSGVSTNTLMKVEQDQTQDPGVLKIAALCRALSVSIDELVRDAERVQSHPEVFMSHGIISVGYEGRTIDAFVADLQRAGVRTVADVRLNAISRKAGFSKTRLKEALAAVGIGYRHMKSLGNAKENRKPFWDGRAEEGRRVYREALRAPDAGALLEELSEMARDHVVAVLCFETDLEMCHRKVIIDEVVSATAVPVAALPT
jgi:transcriptional regulator with XRE-family HTH domain